MSRRIESVASCPPVSRHRAVAIGVVLALALVGVAVVAVRDLAVTEGWATGEPWLAEGVRRLDGLEPSTGVLALATAVAVLGLLLVLAGLLPAGRHTCRHPGSSTCGRARRHSPRWLAARRTGRRASSAPGSLAPRADASSSTSSPATA